MRLPTPPNQSCQETTGFLFHHACANPVSCQCDECKKFTCEHHSVAEGMSTYCTTCAKKLARSSHGTRQLRPSSAYDDDPYWYSDNHYRGYGYYGSGYWGHAYISGSSSGSSHQRQAPDPNDFTESDTASVRAEGDANFENEIGGS